MTYSAPRYLLRRHTILRHLRPGNTFLEIGVGNIMLSRELTKHFEKGTGIDFSPKVRQLYLDLPPRVREKLDVIVADFSTYGFDEKFDCVVSCEVMEHIEDDQNFLAQAHSLVKKGGQIIISVPARKKYWTVHDEIVGHYRRYEKQELQLMFKDAGFHNVLVLSYGFPFINLLWRLRRIHGGLQAKSKASWSKQRQTEESGVGQLSKRFDFLGVIANKYVFYLPNLLASAFDRFNLSEGYVVVADN